MSPIWDPELVFGLRSEQEPGWQCVGETISPRCGASERCQRRLRAAEIKVAQKLLTEMSSQIPDQVEHNVLLHLARACLCVDAPEPHRGTQEAHVIYRWTGLMSREAEAFRARQPQGDKSRTSPSLLDSFPTPKAFTSSLSEEQHRPEPEIIAPVPISTTNFRPPFPALMLGSSSNILSPTIRMRRGARDSSPTSTLTIVPPFAFPLAPSSAAAPDHSLPPSPPDSATSTLPFPPAPTGPLAPDFTSAAESLAPLPTSTTIETSCSSLGLGTPLRAFAEEGGGLASLAPNVNASQHGGRPGLGLEPGAAATAALTSSALLQLEEYNRLLQETHARQAALLDQVAEMHRQLSRVRGLQLDLRSGLAQLVPR